MKSVYVCLVVFCISFALPGCGDSTETTLATEGATADDFAQYEADLAAANADAGYEEENEEGTE
ncbi:hypothetical protein CKO51_18190 [Rhodopirellula sp. SM50]|nr:hypothetical protein [Rhodopirellula sp. SM50]PAY17944.1 hypothetical protein CKO51_18190 [Rhodopirellula sp. SM50]